MTLQEAMPRWFIPFQSHAVPTLFFDPSVGWQGHVELESSAILTLFCSSVGWQGHIKLEVVRFLGNAPGLTELFVIFGSRSFLSSQFVTNMVRQSADPGAYLVELVVPGGVDHVAKWTCERSQHPPEVRSRESEVYVEQLIRHVRPVLLGIWFPDHGPVFQRAMLDV